MGKNIALLYMSAYFAQPAPEGSKNRFLRTQTNEAAVSALWKDPASRPDKIVALCSDTVRTKPTVPAADGSGNKVPTLEYFRDEFLKQLGVQPEQLVAVSVPDSMEEADQTRAISAVLEQVAENDNLYIDLSGGMRDTATLLLIVARYLKDIRMVQTKKVLYSELKGNSSVVRDSTGLYNLMDLITAVDAFFSTGTTEKLKAYMKQTGETDPDILNLLDRIDHFADDLALCRVQMLKADLKAIARQIKQRPASRETLGSLLYELMNDRFEAEFQNLMGSRSDSLPALVQWCAHHRMYQQGLTLLSEEMPTYLCGHLFLQPTGKALDYMALQPQNKGKGSKSYNKNSHHFPTEVMAVFCYPLAGRTIPGWSKMGKVERDILNTFVPLREECGKGVSACAHRDLCGGASGSTDTPPMPRVVLIPMPP